MELEVDHADIVLRAQLKGGYGHSPLSELRLAGDVCGEFDPRVSSMTRRRHETDSTCMLPGNCPFNPFFTATSLLLHSNIAPATTIPIMPIIPATTFSAPDLAEVEAWAFGISAAADPDAATGEAVPTTAATAEGLAAEGVAADTGALTTGTAMVVGKAVATVAEAAAVVAGTGLVAGTVTVMLARLTGFEGAVRHCLR